MMPEPIQQALAAVLSDPSGVETVRDTYLHRRRILERALREAGWSIDGGDAGLYLWVTRGLSSMDSVEWFAERGILVAPGHFYGPAGAAHVRVALTASDSDIEAAAHRIAAG
jgi:aspartate/methionine/tyrosine aminotransferase